MVRSPPSHSPSRSLHSREARKHSPRARPPRVRSPHGRSTERRKSPYRRASPRRRSPERRRNARQGRFPNRGGGSTTGRGRGKSSGAASNQQGRRGGKNKGVKWRRNKNKKRRRGGMNPNGPPVSGGNRQPIASMRMRMDDYMPPRADRLLPFGKGADIDHAVARARREASTRTKDTFWTKKLLDAEASNPNRWVHSGFKELYREELGYSEQQPDSEDDKVDRSSRSHLKDRKALQRRDSPGRPRSPRTLKQRSRSPRRTPRKHRKSNSLSRSRTKSPRGKKSRSPKSPGDKLRRPRTSPGSRVVKGKDSYSRPNKRSYSRSLSSSSTSTFSSYTRSYSRSYSSYSRSSSSSSSFTTTSSASSLSFRRRSYSRSSHSYSRSPTPHHHPTPPPQPPKIKTAVLSKAVQSVHVSRVSHQETKKKVVTKTVSNTVKVKNSSSSHMQPKIKTKMKDEFAPKKHQAAADLAPRVSDPYFQKETINKPPQYISPSKAAHIAPNNMNPDLRYYKNAPQPNYHRTVIAHKKLPHSEGEESDSDSTSEDDDGPRKMTLSERFGKLAQLSSQRQEYEGVRMKIVREGGQDKKVYLEGGGSRTPSPLGRMHNHPAHERWLREHKAEYDEYQQRYGEFRHWDPHRDLPRELPPNWDDINVRYRYYKESGYFGDRAITMEDYLKWEEWWYRYRDWLEKYGGMQDVEYGGPYSYEGHGTTARWSTRRETSRDKEDRKRRRYQ